MMDGSPLVRAGLDYSRRVHPFENPSVTLGVLKTWRSIINDNVAPGGSGQPLHRDPVTKITSPMVDPNDLARWRLRHARYHRGCEFLQLVPNWDSFAALNTKQSISQVAKGQSEARSNDIRTLRDIIQFKHNLRDDRGQLGSVPLPHSQWGFMQETLGPLLCPITWDWEQPRSRASLRQSGGKLESNLDLSADEAPFCVLYDDGGVNASLPGGTVTDGLMRSTTFIWALRAVSMGPAAAYLTPNQPSYYSEKPHPTSNAVLCNIECLTSKFLAYVATVLRGAMSADIVTANNPTFVYTRFFDVIVDILNAHPAETKELIEFLKDHVVLANHDTSGPTRQRIGPAALADTANIADLRAANRSSNSE